jgi:hypothetical protein
MAPRSSFNSQPQSFNQNQPFGAQAQSFGHTQQQQQNNVGDLFKPQTQQAQPVAPKNDLFADLDFLK